MTNSHPFKGVGVAMVTPFHEDKSIDYSSYEKLIDHLIEGGVNFLVVLGTTGETPTLNLTEQKDLVSKSKDYISGRVPLVVGIGGNNTSAVVQKIHDFDLEGIAGILSSSPNYNKPSQEGIYQHYKAVAGATSLPVILYNVPGRTSSNMTSDTSLRIARTCSNVVAIKEASGDLSQCSSIIHRAGAELSLISGDDILNLPILSIGGLGTISVIANAYPGKCVEMHNAYLNGHNAVAASIHAELCDITEAIFKDGNPGGIKYLLSEIGICRNVLRLPLVPVNQACKSAISLSMLN